MELDSHYCLILQKRLSVLLLTSKMLRKKCPYSELFWSVFSRIRTEYGEYLSVFSPNAVKYGPE